MANLKPYKSAASTLRELLAQDEIIVCPGVYDGFTSRLALKAGFKTLYMVRLYHDIFPLFK
jgi:2-methylisocitrate lyase-like PEP mutase family enzyme